MIGRSLVIISNLSEITPDIIIDIIPDIIIDIIPDNIRDIIGIDFSYHLKFSGYYSSSTILWNIVVGIGLLFSNVRYARHHFDFPPWW